ncbi:MAG: permease [Candidatus Schekmanbacteria bacterium]|nr:permease [Candidatus Schekmanbacteria bacterium]
MAEQCATHHKQHKTINLTLLIMLAAGLGLMFWYVWNFGVSYGGDKAALAGKSFTQLLGLEFWDLLFGGHGFLAMINDVLIYFMIGILVASWIRTYKFHIRLRKTLINYGFSAIFLAAFIGVFSPLCACGILTTVVTLVAAGLPWAPSMALLIAAPLMSPTTFFLTVNDLGIEWAVVRTIVAYSMGVFAGLLTWSMRKYLDDQNLFVDGGIPEGDVHDADYADERLRCTCREKFSNRVARKYKNKFIIFWAKFLEMNWMIGKYVLVGLFVGSIVGRYMPMEFIASLFGTGDDWNILWVTLGSVPLFLHQVSGSTIVYHIKTSLSGTMDNGAALAFMIGGPVTAIPAMLLLWSMFKKRVFILYMAISLLGTLFFAYTFKYFVFVPHVDSGSPVFASVNNLPGGERSVLNKSQKDLQMVADPDGKGMIALHQDVEGGTSVVFDSGLTRFANNSAGKYDNGSYLKNLAKWLEDRASGEVTKSVLVYNTYVDKGMDKNSFTQNIRQALHNPYKVTVTDKATTPELTAGILKDYNQLWIINGGANAKGTFTEDDLEAINSFRDNGGNILLAAGPAKPDGDYTQDVNQLAAEFGVSFSGVSQTNEKLSISNFGRFFGKIGEKLQPWFEAMKKLRIVTERESA